MTATQGTVADSNNQLANLREKQLNLGTLPEAWPRMSPFLMYLKKGAILETWVGQILGRLGTFATPGTGGGASFDKAFANSSPPIPSQFLVPIREMWQHYLIEWLLLSTMKGGIIGNADQKQALEMVVYNFWTMLSILIQEDGTGRWAKGDGAWTITGPTITFVNKKCAHRFEVNDILAITPFDEVVAPGSEATPRAYTGPATQNGPKVTKVNVADGTIETDSADLSADITSLTNADYIGKDSMFGSAQGILDGFQTWIPYTKTLSVLPLFGLDRSVRPDRLAGKRVLVTTADSPAEIVAELLRRTPELSRTSSTKSGMICVPADELANLSLELASMNFKVTDAPDAERDTRTLSMGLGGVVITMGEYKIRLYGDLYLADKELPVEGDRTYHLSLDGAWHLETTPDGLNWQERGRTQILTPIDGSSNVFSAPHGGAGNLWPDQVSDNMVATTRANT